MVRAWLMDDKDGDQRLEHQRIPPVPVSLEEIKNRTGILYCKLDPEANKEQLEDLKKKRGYNCSDIIECSPDKIPNYDTVLQNFFREHIHADEEIRYILEGSGYFDARDKLNDWIRIEVVAGDLIILPAGIYHRFTLDSKNYVKAMRLFTGEPVWTPHYKPDADAMDVRKVYVEEQQRGFEFIPQL